MAFTDDGTYLDDDHRHVTVVDRIGPGGAIKLKSGFEIPGVLYWDLKPHAIKPKFQLRGPPAKHFFRYASSAYVHTADGAYVNRLGIEDGDADLIQELVALAEDAQTCEPIDVDMETVEGWDTAAIDPENRKATKKLKRTARESMGALRAREE